MKHTNEQINKMAAEVLGIVFCDGSFDCDGVCYHCGKHETNLVHGDFCTDLNSAQRLVTSLADTKTRDIFEYAVFQLAPWIEAAFSDITGMPIVQVLSLPAKTITLAALVAAGKISIEDAKESL